MPEKTVKRRLQDLGDKELASDDRPIFSAVAKLVEALSLAIPMSHDLDLKAQALRLGYELLRGTKYEEAKEQQAERPGINNRTPRHADNRR